MTDWQKAPPHHKPFDCITAWHLRNSGLLIAVYDLIGKLTNGGKNLFFSTSARIARYFYLDEKNAEVSPGQHETMRKIFRTLRKLGWLELAGNGHQRWVSHEEWAEKHPNQCNKRELLPWQIETDPLVGHLFAISGGQLKMLEHHVFALRKYSDSDSEIENLFRAEIETARLKRIPGGDWTGTSAKQCLYRVRQSLQARRKVKKATVAG